MGDEFNKLRKKVDEALTRRARSGHEENSAVQGDTRDANSRHETVRELVDAIRKKLSAMAGEGSHQTCTACYVLGGNGRGEEEGHISGDGCPEQLCGFEDGEWAKFQGLLKFGSNQVCFGCLLPTVSAFVFSRLRSLLTGQQAVKAGIPGAERHRYDECTNKFLVKPAIYAFWCRAPAGLREYVSRQVNFEWRTMENFAAWCTGSDKKLRLGNHLLLFWWIIRYWEEVDA